MKKALLILFENFEEIEAVCPVDILRRAGVELVTASLNGENPVRGRSAIKITADKNFDECARESFDALIIPGGAGVLKAAEDARLLKLIAEFNAEGRLLCAICAAPVALFRAGVLEGRKYTSHFSVLETLKESDQSRGVVRDTNVITSRGAGTAEDFALEIARALVSDECAAEIAASICKE